ncbi:hypothetical protein BLNAU_15468 [Blattamonas nauphoetae]|uniref:Uncharacterized protein n=1 Tax=Blattamonas nauphoetae TaxID=2049346 RepID=A0ABQ9XE95_9EUKA|nr:hypothetical protein BLNAU_15468 [Blattamonas nauphoetae]
MNDDLEVRERSINERSIRLQTTVISVGERPVPCERSFDADALNFPPKTENPMYSTSNNEYGYIQPRDFHESIKYKGKPTTFVKQFPAGPTRSTGLNTAKTHDRYFDAHTVPEY